MQPLESLRDKQAWAKDAPPDRPYGGLLGIKQTAGISGAREVSQAQKRPPSRMPLFESGWKEPHGTP